MKYVGQIGYKILIYEVMNTTCSNICFELKSRSVKYIIKQMFYHYAKLELDQSNASLQIIWNWNFPG